MSVVCRYCNHNSVIRDGVRIARDTTTVQRLYCRNCNKRFQTRYLKPRISPLEEKIINKSYKNGETVTEILKALPIDHARSTVNKYLKRDFGRIGLIHTEFKFNSKLEGELGEFVGAVAGDGYMDLKRNAVYIFPNGKEVEYAKHLSKLIFRLFNKNANIWYNKNSNVISVRIYSHDIIKILRENLKFIPGRKTKTVELSNIERNKKYLSGFARGLFDTDGSIYTNGHSPGLFFASTSKHLASQYSKILSIFGIKNRLYRKRQSRYSYAQNIIYSVEAFGIDDVLRFHNKIGTSEKNRLNKLKACGFYRISIPNYCLVDV